MKLIVNLPHCHLTVTDLVELVANQATDPQANIEKFIKRFQCDASKLN